MENTKIFGSLYFGEVPVDVGARYNGQPLNIGDTVPGKAITWVAVNGILIADRCVCDSISWEQLNDAELVFGKKVSIDGHQYLCRLLRVGNGADTINEWDAALSATSKDDELWHWKQMEFWGQDTPKSSTPYIAASASCRVVRGHFSPDYWYFRSAVSKSPYVGFRPVLEPLDTDVQDPDAKKKNWVALYHNCAVRDAQICKMDQDSVEDPWEDEHWEDVEEAEVFIGIFTAETEREAEELAAAQENCDRAAIRVIEVPGL